MNQNKIEISKENVITKKNEENTVKIQKSPKLSSEQYHKEDKDLSNNENEERIIKLVEDMKDDTCLKILVNDKISTSIFY